MGEKKSSNPLIPISIIFAGILISAGVVLKDNLNLVGLGENRESKTADANIVATRLPKLYALANEVGVDGEAVKKCVEAGDNKDEVVNDKTEGARYGATGTPTFFIGKSAGDTFEAEKLVGAQPFAKFEKIIEEYLADSVPTTPPPTVTVSVDDDPMLGDPNAPVTMIEFSDYECPYCKRHTSLTYPELKSKYIDTGKVRLVYRDLPLSFHDPAASREAEAAECVGDLGGDSAYFKFRDKLFESTQGNGKGIEYSNE